MTPIIGDPGDEGEYCAGFYYELTADGVDPNTCLAINWNVASVPGPNVDPLDVEFTSKQGLTTFVKVPVTGTYCFNWICKVEA